MIDDVLAEVKDRMDKTIESFRHDLQSIRTGRANPALLDKISVDYYGTPTPLKQIANISVPEAQQLLIRPYSSSDIKAIETAISKSDLGLTPNNDGAQIRLNLPP
jgi:ribosome recycling factor